MDGIEITVEGLDGVQEMLDKLATKTGERVIRKSLRVGAKFEQQAQASAAPIRPDLPSGTALPVGALANDVVISIKRGNQGFEATVGPGAATKHAANWVEYGHRLVKGGYSKISKRNSKDKGAAVGPGKQIGFVPEHSYIRTTFESTADRVADLIISSLKEEVTKASENGGN